MNDIHITHISALYHVNIDKSLMSEESGVQVFWWKRR